MQRLNDWRILGAVMITVVLILVSLGVAGAVVWDWKFGIPISDKGTRINAIVALGAFLLVAVGVVVSLVAYLAATGRPDLAPYVTCFGQSGTPIINAVKASEHESWAERASSAYMVCNVLIRNRAPYAARNPGVRLGIRSKDLSFKHWDGWQPVNASDIPFEGVKSIQWDGGSDQMIHGNWTRRLPPVVVKIVPDQPKFVIAVVADNFRPEIFDVDPIGKSGNAHVLKRPQQKTNSLFLLRLRLFKPRIYKELRTWSDRIDMQDIPLSSLD